MAKYKRLQHSNYCHFRPEQTTKIVDIILYISPRKKKFNPYFTAYYFLWVPFTKRRLWFRIGLAPSRRLVIDDPAFWCQYWILLVYIKTRSQKINQWRSFHLLVYLSLRPWWFYRSQYTIHQFCKTDSSLFYKTLLWYNLICKTNQR